MDRKKNFKRQLLIDQREIGILGYILYQGKKSRYILIQSKVEPGNIGLAQIAPTCQATLSNIDCIHGGISPEFVDNFTEKNQEIINSSLQSEQGSRFYGKRNHNIIIISKYKIKHPNNFKWIKVKTLCHLLDKDYLINTDSRSVLVSTNWQMLINQKIFSKNTTFIQELHTSYFTDKFIISTIKVLKKIKLSSAKFKPPKIVPISTLVKYNTFGSKIDSENKNGFRLIHIKVQTNGREVTNWDQPIAKSYQISEYTVYCGRQDNILYFCFEILNEPGLYNFTEIGPLRNTLIKGKLIKSCWQSDEGGRFYQDKNKYSLIDIGKIKQITKNSIWLSLKQVQELCLVSGIFCNEARSSISLILSMI